MNNVPENLEKELRRHLDKHKRPVGSHEVIPYGKKSMTYTIGTPCACKQQHKINLNVLKLSVIISKGITDEGRIAWALGKFDYVERIPTRISCKLISYRAGHTCLTSLHYGIRPQVCCGRTLCAGDGAEKSAPRAAP